MIDYQEYIGIFSEKVANVFKLTKTDDRMSVYTHTHLVNNEKETIEIYCYIKNRQPTNVEILKLWISHCSNYNFRFGLTKIERMLSDIYQNIPIQDLDLYIYMSCDITTYSHANDVILIKDLITLFKSTKLDLYDYMEKYFSLFVYFKFMVSCI